MPLSNLQEVWKQHDNQHYNIQLLKKQNLDQADMEFSLKQIYGYLNRRKLMVLILEKVQ